MPRRRADRSEQTLRRESAAHARRGGRQIRRRNGRYTDAEPPFFAERRISASRRSTAATEANGSGGPRSRDGSVQTAAPPVGLPRIESAGGKHTQSASERRRRPGSASEGSTAAAVFRPGHAGRRRVGRPARLPPFCPNAGLPDTNAEMKAANGAARFGRYGRRRLRLANHRAGQALRRPAFPPFCGKVRSPKPPKAESSPLPSPAARICRQPDFLYLDLIKMFPAFSSVIRFCE